MHTDTVTWLYMRQLQTTVFNQYNMKTINNLRHKTPTNLRFQDPICGTHKHEKL